ncbi:MAG TPA: VLRF1 family aeRF1-type release factor [Gaiellaceae bacterium]|nr:VLRF1 family aeRF1-type release factor [Gaiellaceae bacterium]
MGSTVIERTTELRGLVASLAQLRDGIGVLSIAIGIEPGAVSGGTPSWEIALENDLNRLDHDSSARSTLKRRLEQASTPLEELLDPATSGRGRALYVALESGAASQVILHRQLLTGARIGPAAHVLPLLAALVEGECAGLIGASRDAISVLESELGTVRDVDHIELEPSVGDWWPEMKGPVRANPQRGQQVVSQRDRYARRIAEAYRHTLDEAAIVIGALAGERGWKRAVLAGDPRRTDVLDTVLREHGLATTAIAANLEGLRAEDALERLENALGTLVDRQRARLAEDVVSAANGVCGLVPVLAVLAEARVDRLLIDVGRTFPGVVGPGESLAAAEPGEDAADLTDLIVARALATDAVVTPLSGDTTRALAASEGIAAALRW